jgi:hypothetical protein
LVLVSVSVWDLIWVFFFEVFLVVGFLCASTYSQAGDVEPDQAELHGLKETLADTPIVGKLIRKAKTLDQVRHGWRSLWLKR